MGAGNHSYSCLESVMDKEPGGLHSIGSQRVGYDLVTEHEVFKRRRLIKSILVHLVTSILQMCMY